MSAGKYGGNRKLGGLSRRGVGLGCSLAALGSVVGEAIYHCELRGACAPGFAQAWTGEAPVATRAVVGWALATSASLKIFDEGIGDVGAVVVGDAGGGALYVFH